MNSVFTKELLFKLFEPRHEETYRLGFADAQADLRFCRSHRTTTGFLMTRLIFYPKRTYVYFTSFIGPHHSSCAKMQTILSLHLLTLRVP